MTVKRWGTPNTQAEMRVYKDGEYVLFEDYEVVRKARDAWELAEYEARQGIPECTVCPHLGHGDPLVDPIARELKELKETIAELLVLDFIKEPTARRALRKFLEKQ